MYDDPELRRIEDRLREESGFANAVRAAASALESLWLAVWILAVLAIDWTVLAIIQAL